MHNKSLTDISLNEILLYAQQHWTWILLAVFCAAAGNFSHFYSSPKYKASAQFLVNQSYASSMESNQMDGQYESGMDAVSKFGLYISSNALAQNLFQELKDKNQLSLLSGLRHQKNANIQNLLNQIGLAKYFEKIDPRLVEAPKNPTELFALLQNKVSTTLGQHNIVAVSVHSYSPRTSIALVNLIMKLGIRGVTESYLKESNNEIEFMDSQVTETKARLKNIERELTAVKVKKEGASSKVKESSSQLNDLKNQLLQSEQNIYKLEGLIKDLGNQKNLDYANRNRLFKMKRELAFWNSNMTSLKKMVKNVKGQGPHFSINLQLAANIDNLERQQTFEFSNLASLQKSLLQLKMKKLLIEKNIRVIEKASQNKILVAKMPMISFFASMILAAFSVLFFFFMKDNLSPTLKSRDDIENLNFINFGSVPDLNSGKHLLNTKAFGEPKEDYPFSIAKNSPESFVFGAIRSKVLHCMEGADKMQLISVTSPQQNEGKSLITAKLATSLANANKKVLLVDGDVMRKDISRDFQVLNKLGFGDILQGQASLKDAILKTEHCENLDILPAGTGAGSVADYLLSGGRLDFFNECRSLYDIVIFDNLAFLLVPDSLLLCRFSDLTLVVGCAGTTKVADLVNTAKDLRENGVNNIGCVINKNGSLLKYVYIHPTEKSPALHSGQRVS